MKVLIFDDRLTGHHLEYIHHLYMMALCDTGNEYVFAVPESFDNVKSKMVWPDCSNISFDLFPEFSEMKSFSIIEQLKRSLTLSTTLARFVRKYQIDAAFVNDLISFLPFAPILVCSRVKLCGVIYRIYLYRYNELSVISKLLEKFKYTIFAKCKLFHRIFILNDDESAKKLCSIYKTPKFVSIEDPVVPLPKVDYNTFRRDNNIEDKQILLIHFGGLAKRKGTLNILDSISLLSEAERKKYVFVFAGKINKDIKCEFYTKLKSLLSTSRIIVKDEFCSYEYLSSICYACDAIVCPYLDTSLSSGMLGYASQYQKPVIMPDFGLLGNLVKKNKLGILVKDCSNEELIKGYRVVENHLFEPPTTEYSDKNCVARFQKTIINNIFD